MYADPVGVSREFEAGAAAQVARVVAGGRPARAEQPQGDDRRGAARDRGSDFADVLLRAAAFARVVATGRASLNGPTDAEVQRMLVLSEQLEAAGHAELAHGLGEALNSASTSGRSPGPNISRYERPRREALRSDVLSSGPGLAWGPCDRCAASSAAVLRPVPSDRPGSGISYAPVADGRPDPGEVVWAWVAYEDDPSRGRTARCCSSGGTGTGCSA